MTTFLITGANRGIGRGIFNHYVAKPGNTIVAGVRDVDNAQGLITQARGDDTKVIIVKIDSSSETDAKVAVDKLQTEYGINHIDVVVSSAGIVRLSSLEDLAIADLQEHIFVNGLSVLILYQATLPLLRKSKNKPRFVFISAAGGSITDAEKYPFPNASYLASKSMANALVKKMHLENDWLIAFPIHPGWVQTDMGNEGAKAAGLEKAALTLEESTNNTADAIDNCTKEQTSGKFWNETRFNPIGW